MKRLYLLRHAKSSWDDESLDDFDRPLARRGSDAAPRIGKHMKGQDWIPDVVLCSAARRAVETFERVAPALGIDGAASIDRDLYMADPEQLLQRIQALPDSATAALLIGHNPGHEVLARALAVDGRKKAMKQLRKKFPTGALAVIDLPAEQWSDVAPGTGYLEAFVRPKDL